MNLRTKLKLQEMIRRIIKEESQSSNFIKDQIVEDSAWLELTKQVPQKELDKIAKTIAMLDKRVTRAKNYDGGDFFDENMQELDFLFPIDSADDFFAYLQKYIEIVEDEMKNPPEKITSEIHNFIQKYK